MESTDELIKGLVDLESPLQLAPKEPDKCPVFAVFYAEFDIKKGPVVRYQSPKNFLDRDINTTTAEIHEILEKTFERLKVEENNANATSNRKHQERPRDDDAGNGDVEANSTDDDGEVVLNSSPKNPRNKERQKKNKNNINHHRHRQRSHILRITCNTKRKTVVWLV